MRHIFRVTIFMMAVALIGADASAQGAMLVVTSSGDGSDGSPGDGICATGGSGPCTLRAAIQEANALPGPDTIQFAIGSGAVTISVPSALPAVSSPAIINGTTQPGYSGSPLITLDGNGGGGTVTVTAGNTTVRGLVIVRFSGDGLTLRSGGNNVVENSYIGIASDGGTDAGNGRDGILIDNSPNNRIGGPSLSQRNVIAGNDGKGNGGGIKIEGAGGNVIQNNFIGIDATGMLERPNQGRGIAISGSSNNLIGGPGAGMGNLIAGNRATGVRMLGGSSNNTVQGNFIGVNRTVTAFIANDRGVQIRGGSGNQVLGNLIAGQTYDGVLVWQDSTDNLIQGNIIAYNGLGPVGDPMEAGFNGVWIAEGVRNRVVSNSIYANGLRGIDLGVPQSINPNDPGDGDSGANNLQNFPVITSATASTAMTRIVGTLNSTANTGFLVQLYADTICDPSGGHGEGRYLLGQTDITTNASGNATFDVSLGLVVQKGWAAAATATDTAGNTSEFSACATIR